MKETLTQEQLWWLMQCWAGNVSDDYTDAASYWLRSEGFGEASDTCPGMLQPTPAGHKLVDTALAAVNGGPSVPSPLLAELEKLTRRWKRGRPGAQDHCVGVANGAQRECARELLAAIAKHGQLERMYCAGGERPDLGELRALAQKWAAGDMANLELRAPGEVLAICCDQLSAVIATLDASEKGGA